MIKLIASDMDGTLLNEDHIISKENMRAIKFARDNGVEFMLATGRAYYEAIQPIKEANLETELICLNGAMTLDKKGNVLSTINLDLEDINFIVNTFKNLSLPYQLYTKKCLYVNSIDEHVQPFLDLLTSQGHDVNKEAIMAEAMERKEAGHLVEVDNIDNYLNDKDNPVIKIITLSPDTTILEQAAKLLEKNKNISVTSSGMNNLEITNAQATKGNAIKKIAKEKNISLDNIMTIGDNLNDLSMIDVAKYGVAVANANQKLKDIAEYVAETTNSQNAVANMIFKLLGEENDLHDK